jgi:hypothetical protein
VAGQENDGRNRDDLDNPVLLVANHTKRRIEHEADLGRQECSVFAQGAHIYRHPFRCANPSRAATVSFWVS